MILQCSSGDGVEAGCTAILNDRASYTAKAWLYDKDDDFQVFGALALRS
jgi:hypothetical protein